VTAAELIADLRGRGFTLAESGGKVRVSPASHLTPDDRLRIGGLVPQLLDELRLEARAFEAGGCNPARSDAHPSCRTCGGPSMGRFAEICQPCLDAEDGGWRASVAVPALGTDGSGSCSLNRGSVMSNDTFDSGRDDREGLGPIALGDEIIMGCVWEVNGPGSEAFEGYSPTRAELLILARHWYEEYLSTATFCFFHATSGSSEIRSMEYALRRVERIDALIGGEAVKEVIEQLRAAERRRLGEEEWQAFITGDSAAALRWMEEWDRADDLMGAKEADEASCRAAWDYLRARPTGVYFDQSNGLWYLAESTGESGAEPGRLVLTVRIQDGSSRKLSSYVVERPLGWSAPFGLK
jgi:hypothetical protein